MDPLVDKTIPDVPPMRTSEERDSHGAAQLTAGSRTQTKCVGVQVTIGRHHMGGEDAHLRSIMMMMMMTTARTKTKTVIIIALISMISFRASWGTQTVWRCVEPTLQTVLGNPGQ